MTVKVKLDAEAVRRVPIELVTPLVRKTAAQVERRGRGTVRVLTGAVRSSIKTEMKITRTRVVATVSATHRRAMLEHEGAKAHQIVPRLGNRKLRFYWKKVGRVVYFSSVNHPGTKGSKFLTKPLLLIGERNGFRVTIHNL